MATFGILWSVDNCVFSAALCWSAVAGFRVKSVFNMYLHHTGHLVCQMSQCFSALVLIVWCHEVHQPS